MTLRKPTHCFISLAHLMALAVLLFAPVSARADDASPIT